MKKVPAARTPTVAQSVAPPHAAAAVASYCKDLEEWPRSWMGMETDIPAGEKMVACFRPFILHLAGLGLSRKTVRKHVDNLWILGGELIRDLHETPSLRKRAVADLIFHAVEDGGILPHHHDSEEQVRSFESTCRKFRRFLEQQRGQR